MYLLIRWSLIAMVAIMAIPAWSQGDAEKVYRIEEDKTIPDDDVDGVTSIFQMLDEFTISDLDVYVEISHPYPADLIVEITAPGGKTATLHYRAGIPGIQVLRVRFDDDAPYADPYSDPNPVNPSWRPYTPLSVFNGDPSRYYSPATSEWIDTWRLKIMDRSLGDSGGVLFRWIMYFNNTTVSRCGYLLDLVADKNQLDPYDIDYGTDPPTKIKTDANIASLSAHVQYQVNGQKYPAVGVPVIFSSSMLVDDEDLNYVDCGAITRPAANREHNAVLRVPGPRIPSEFDAIRSDDREIMTAISEGLQTSCAPPESPFSGRLWAPLYNYNMNDAMNLKLALDNNGPDRWVYVDFVAKEGDNCYVLYKNLQIQIPAGFSFSGDVVSHRLNGFEQAGEYRFFFDVRDLETGDLLFSASRDMRVNMGPGAVDVNLEVVPGYEHFVAGEDEIALHLTLRNTNNELPVKFRLFAMPALEGEDIAPIDFIPVTEVALPAGFYYSREVVQNYPLEQSLGFFVEISNMEDELIASDSINASVYEAATTDKQYTDSNGYGCVEFSSPRQGATLIQVTALDPEGNECTAITEIQVGNPNRPNNVLLEISTSSVHVQGTGANDSAMVTAKVYDTTGTVVVDGTPVRFDILEGPGGGEKMNPDWAQTSEGAASSTFTAGLRSGTVRIKVTISEDAFGEPLPKPISAISTPVTINSGPPFITFYDEQAEPDLYYKFPFGRSHMSMSASTYNIQGWDLDASETTVMVLIGDKYNNPVVDGTSIWFTTTGGIIGGQAATTDGAAGVTMRTANPRPYLLDQQEMRIPNCSEPEFLGKCLNWPAGCNDDFYMFRAFPDLLYMAQIPGGGEPYCDGDLDGFYDDGDTFNDVEGYRYDASDPCLFAKNLAGVRDGISYLDGIATVQAYCKGETQFGRETYTDLNGNGSYDNGEPFVDVNGNGRYDPEIMQNAVVWDTVPIVFSSAPSGCSYAVITNPPAEDVLGCNSSVNIRVRAPDVNGNILPAGTTIQGRISEKYGILIPEKIVVPSSYGPIWDYSFTFVNVSTCSKTPTADVKIIFDITTPAGSGISIGVALTVECCEFEEEGK